MSTTRLFSVKARIISYFSFTTSSIARTNFSSILENNFAEYYKILFGKNIGLSSKEIGEAIKENRFWVIKNALSDASHVNISRIFKVCQILLNADENLKSKVTDERICLENAVNESLIALFGDKL